MIWIVNVGTLGSCELRDTIQINATPITRYNVTDLVTGLTTGSYCETEPITLVLSGSESGTTSYQVFDGVTPVSASVVGTGSAINLPITLGVLTPSVTPYQLKVIATFATCSDSMLNYVDITVNPSLKLDLRVMLEGALDTSGAVPDMIPGLNIGGGYTLLDSIFGAGTIGTVDGSGFMVPADSNASVPNLPTNIIDLIRIELRSTAAGAMVDSAYVWLMPDGSVRDFSTGVTRAYADFCAQTGNGDYYVVVRHRNHVAIMTRNPFTLSDVVNGAPLDLTDISQLYEEIGYSLGAQYYNVTSQGYNVAAMYAGNNYDNMAFFDIGEVNAADFYRCRLASQSNPGDVYQVEDAMLDGDLNGSDDNLTGFNNYNLFITRVP